MKDKLDKRERQVGKKKTKKQVEKTVENAVAKALTKSRTHALVDELKPVMSGRAVSLFKSSFFEVT